jgi:major membrane immunogen (membrane-anchored lipoprotein)
MAAFVFKRTSFGATANRGRKATMNDASMTKVLNAYKANYGQIKDEDSGVMRDMTDDEVTDKIFDGILQGLVNAGDAQAKIVAAKTASDAVTPISAPIVADNA